MEQSTAEVVLDHYLNKYQMAGNMISDISFNELPFLKSREATTNMKGELVSKSWYAPNGKECVRIVFSKVIGIHKYNGVDYPNTWLGFQDEIHYIRWDGVQPRIKYMQAYDFTLEPVFIGDGTETIIGFSSPKLRKTLKEERYRADDYLQAKNPNLYALLFERYTAEYEYYLKTGKKANLVTAIGAETDVNISAVFDNLVYGTAITVRDLILMNLQG